MNKNKNNNGGIKANNKVSVKSVKVKRGRPAKPLTLPKGEFMTVNDIWAANPHIKCRLSIYTKVGELIKARVLRSTRKTAPSNGENHVGKPLDIYQTVQSYKLSSPPKKAKSPRKLATVTVNMTPEESVTVPETEAATA